MAKLSTWLVGVVTVERPPDGATRETVSVFTPVKAGDALIVMEAAAPGPVAVLQVRVVVEAVALKESPYALLAHAVNNIKAIHVWNLVEATLGTVEPPIPGIENFMINILVAKSQRLHAEGWPTVIGSLLRFIGKILASYSEMFTIPRPVCE